MRRTEVVSGVPSLRVRGASSLHLIRLTAVSILTLVFYSSYDEDQERSGIASERLNERAQLSAPPRDGLPWV